VTRRILLDPVWAAPVLRTMAPETKRKVKASLRLLAKDPSGTTNRLDVKRLDTEPGQPMYRLRVGVWRIAFTLDKDIFVLRIFHRRDGYGWLADME
jgi:mRNA-degrading endonuclease RelE of RelBE toxin-antitoxin system